MNMEWEMNDEYWQNMALGYRDYTKELAFKAVDLIQMSSQEAYDALYMAVWINTPDQFRFSEEVPRDYTEENAKALLELAKNELIRLWRNVLEHDKSHADEAREWLDNSVIGAALAGSRDDEKAKVAEYLDELKEVKPHELLRGR